MVVGQTSSSVTKADIFSQYSEAEILSSVFPEIKSLPCLINSPLRKDSHPSFSIYLTDGNHIRYKDHGELNESGSLLDLLCKYWGCTFNQALDKINHMLKGNDVTIKPKKIKTFTRKEADSNTKIQVAVRPWKDFDFEYWESYGITRKWLHYAEIYPISHKIITKKDSQGKEQKYIFTADKYAYCFVERKEGKLQLKIYQPYNTKGFKWCSKMDGSVVGLWTKIPEKGDKVIICSSLKDALCISCQLNIPTLCLQGEGYSMSKTAIRELKRRYEKVFISFDVDNAGKKDAEKLAEETGFINIVPDLGTEKDYSDYYKSLADKQHFKHLKELFN